MDSPQVKTALIFGGGSGMGRASALALAEKGIQPLVADLNLEAAKKTADEAAALQGQSCAFKADVSSTDSVNLVFEEAGAIELVVNAAGILGRTAFLSEVSDRDWQQMMAVNLTGAFNVARAAVKSMRDTGGRLILFSSVASLTPSPGAAPYSAAKGAVNMLTKTLAVEAARQNIRVNAIAPGYVETPMLGGLPEGFEQYIIKKTPLKRLGRAEEVAALVAFLASKEADFITGQIISPNGGLVI